MRNLSGRRGKSLVSVKVGRKPTMALTRNNTWLELEHYLQVSIDLLNAAPVKILSHRLRKRPGGKARE